MSGFQRTHMDSSLGVQTPEGVEFVLYPAGLPIRACAYGLDLLVQWAFAAAVNIIIGSLRELLGFWMVLIILFGINWFYHVVCEIFFKGQSLGKRILGLRVVMGNGAPVEPGASFLRNLLRFADTFMFLYLIALVCMAISRGFRRLGDWVADTLVVYTTGTRPLYRLSGDLSRVPPAAPPHSLSYEEKQAILMFARRYPLLGPARADEIARGYAACLRDEPGEEGSPGDYLLGIARKLGGDEPSQRGMP
jgi:uncharacterized RDD family membrane protein YckC